MTYFLNAQNNLLRQGGTPKNMRRSVIIPGIHDIHQHPLEAKTQAGASCELNEFDSLEELAAQIWYSGCAYEGVDPNWALGMYYVAEKKNHRHKQNHKVKVIFRLKTRSDIKKYKLDTIQFTIFISKDHVILCSQNCIIAN